MSCHDALMASEVLSGKLHANFLCYLRGQTMLVPVLFGKTDDNVVGLYVSFFLIFVPLSVCNLAVNAVRPHICIYGVD